MVKRLFAILLTLITIGCAAPQMDDPPSQIEYIAAGSFAWKQENDQVRIAYQIVNYTDKLREVVVSFRLEPGGNIEVTTDMLSPNGERIGQIIATVNYEVMSIRVERIESRILGGGP